MTYDKLEHKISGAIFKIFGPMQSNPVAFVTSRFFKKFRTNELLISGMLNIVLLGTLAFTYYVICLKSDFSAGPLSCAVTFTMYLLKTFAISLSSEIS